MITAYYSGNILSIVYFIFSIYFSSCADILSMDQSQLIEDPKRKEASNIDPTKENNQITNQIQSVNINDSYQNNYVENNEKKNEISKKWNAELIQLNIARYKKFIRLWKLVTCILLCSIIYKYLFLFIISSMSNFFGINLPWDSIDFGCDPYYRNTFSSFVRFGDKSDYVKCIEEWKKWLIMHSDTDQDTSISILLDFTTTLCMLLTTNLFDNKIFNKPPTTAENLKLQQYKNFTKPMNRQKSIIATIKFFIFCHSVNFSLIVFIIIGLITGTDLFGGNLLSVLYVAIGIYCTAGDKLLIFRRPCYKNKKLSHQTWYTPTRLEVWTNLERFNLLFMVLLIIYELPIFECPINLDFNRYYFSGPECKAFLNSQVALHHFTDSQSILKKFYIVMVNTIGLEKVYGQLLMQTPKILYMCLFFFLGMMQRRIWDHRYSKAFVDEYFIEQNKTVYTRALSYVQHYWENKIWTYLYATRRFEIMKIRQKRIDRKVRVWEGFVSKDQLDKRDLMNPGSSRELLENKDLIAKNIILTETPFEKCGEKFKHNQFSDHELGDICQKAEEFCLKPYCDEPIIP